MNYKKFNFVLPYFDEPIDFGSLGEVTGSRTGRVIANFSKKDEAESFCSLANGLLRIEKFVSENGKEYDYDSSSVVIKHDRDTGEFSWWTCAFHGDTGERLRPITELDI